MKNLLITLFIIFVFAFMQSCDKSEVSSNEQKQSESILKTTDPTATLELKVQVSNSTTTFLSSNMSRGPIATLWRKNSNCTRLGICKWFPKTNNVIDDRTFEGREVVTPIIYNSSTGLIDPVVLEYTSLPTFLSQSDIKFYIDEDFELEVTSEMNLPFNKVVIQEGVIEYNSSIGQYGGYTLQIVGLN
jgi:hypothetical protein